MGRKPSRLPRPRFPNLQVAKRSGGKFAFRARFTVEGRQVTGPWRDDQATASADADKLRRYRAPRANASTLAEALDLVEYHAEQRGAAKITITNHLRSHAKWLRSWWAHDILLAEIDQEEVCFLIREALARGRKPGTLAQKDLPLLDRAFRVANLESPVPAARRAMGGALRPRPQLRQTLTPAEIGAIIDRIRSATWEPRADANKEHAADVIELIALTGIRAGELARTRVEDFDAAAGTLAIPHAKDRTNPRKLPLVGGAVDALVRIMARTAESGRGDGVVFPGGMNEVSGICTRWGKRVGEKRLNARALRHSYATALVELGLDPARLQGALGHRSLRTTSIYVHGSTHGLRLHVEALAQALRQRELRAAAQALRPAEKPAPPESDAQNQRGTG